MRATIEDFCKVLREEEFFNEEAEEWQFHDGSACSICTASAKQIAQRFRGLVLGYQWASNPTASIGLPAIDGHDFALIDDRWLVDYWAWHVAGLVTTPIFDLTIDHDRSIVTRLYGPQRNWSEVELNRSDSHGRRLDPAREHARAHDLPEHDAPRRRGRESGEGP